MQNMKKINLKYITLFVGALLLRLLPFRAPNVEPIMAIQMPFAKKYGALSAFLFGAMSITVYDLMTSGLGVWTFITALAYGLVGIFASLYFQNKNNSKNKKTNRSRYVLFAIVATIAYDAMTGLTLGPLFFGQTFLSALVGQIPFTALHLLGNISFAFLLSPAIERWIASPTKVVSPRLVLEKVKI